MTFELTYHHGNNKEQKVWHLALLIYLGNFAILSQLNWMAEIKIQEINVSKQAQYNFLILFNFSYQRLSNELEESTSSRGNNKQNVFKKKYRIETKSCKISDLPTFDQETNKLFSHLNDPETIWKCDHKPIKIKRFNETYIRFDWTELGFKPFCYYRRLSRGNDDFHYNFGIIPFKQPR